MASEDASLVDSATQTLELALCNPTFYRPLETYSAEEHNQENLLLWRAIRDYEDIDVEDHEARARAAERIVAKFVRSGGALEVNMEEVRSEWARVWGAQERSGGTLGLAVAAGVERREVCVARVSCACAGSPCRD